MLNLGHGGYVMAGFLWVRITVGCEVEGVMDDTSNGMKRFAVEMDGYKNEKEGRND